MATFIPVATTIRESFLRSIDLSTPLLARSIAEQTTSRADLRVHRHTSETACSEKQWLALRGLAETHGNDGAFYLPRGREMNMDKIVWMKYEDPALYCGITKTELAHLSGPDIVQNRVVFRVPGPVTRTYNGISPLGIPLYTSWVGYTRNINVNWNIPGADVDADVDADANGDADVKMNIDVFYREENDEKNGLVSSICLDEKGITRNEFPIHVFSLSGINIYDPAIHWECGVALWKRIDKNGRGRIQITFPITIFGRPITPKLSTGLSLPSRIEARLGVVSGFIASFSSQKSVRSVIIG